MERTERGTVRAWRLVCIYGVYCPELFIGGSDTVTKRYIAVVSAGVPGDWWTTFQVSNYSPSSEFRAILQERAGAEI